MNESLEQLNEKYGLKLGEEEKDFITKNHIHPILKKWLGYTWVVHNIYRLLGTERISSGKARELVAGVIENAMQSFKKIGEKFQERVNEWMQVCFGEQISKDKVERNHRFLEESLELVQSLGCTKSEAHQLVDYVFDRPKGEPQQECGGVMVTLAALCLANELDMQDCGEIELRRIWTKVDQIRDKQSKKPKHSPLPISQSPVNEGMSEEQFTDFAKKIELWTQSKEYNEQIVMGNFSTRFHKLYKEFKSIPILHTELVTDQQIALQALATEGEYRNSEWKRGYKIGFVNGANYVKDKSTPVKISN